MRDFLLRTLNRIVERRDRRAAAAGGGADPAAPPGLAAVEAGNAHFARGDLDAAEAHYRRAIDFDATYPAARLNLGNVLLRTGRPVDAEAAYRVALRLRPGWSEAWIGLACALEATDTAAALAAYDEALRLDPAHAGAARNAAALHRALGHPEEALRLQDVVVAADPADALAASDRLFTLGLVPGITADRLLDEHRAWARRHADPVPRLDARTASDPARRLRVGYVSADFCRHPVALFIAPVLRAHDAAQVETFCYSSTEHEDAITASLRGLALNWRELRGLDDAAAAALIAADRIDLLVDLAGHTAGHRLGVFARRPAPVQLTWLGYLGTTGMAAMDYRLCDAGTDPPGQAERWQVERPLRLPDSQWCYEPAVEVASSPLPYRVRGYWTFGSFNQGQKLNPPLLDTWATLMAQVPASRLRFAGIGDSARIGEIASAFAQRGIAGERLDFVPRTTLAEYFAGHAEVDVALDSFPYAGGTTTCDALYAGVPVATVAGERSVARSGVSLLHTAGLADWIAPSLAALPAMVRGHLADPARLAARRAELHASLRTSALMDAPRFTRHLEALYRQAWRSWCAAASDH